MPPNWVSRNPGTQGVYISTAVFRFNDPFEFKVSITCDADEKRLRAKFFKENPGKSEEDFESWKRSTLRPNGTWWVKNTVREEYLRTLGVICFTFSPESHLMWSHYGPDHLSFCAAFDPAALLKVDDLLIPGPMRYSKSLRTFNFITQRERTFVKSVFFTKSVVWRYEREYRLVFKRQGVVNYPPEALKGIVLGCRAHSPLRDYVRGLLDSPQLCCEQMVESQKDYRLLRTPLEKNVCVMTSHF